MTKKTLKKRRASKTNYFQEQLTGLFLAVKFQLKPEDVIYLISAIAQNAGFHVLPGKEDAARQDFLRWEAGVLKGGEDVTKND